MDQKGIEEKWEPSAGLHRFAVTVAVLTVFLLVAGALVTSNEAGDSVPDWPLSFGRWLINSNYFVANVRYEYSHRVIAGLVGFTTFILAVWAWKTDRRPWVRRLAVIAFGGVVAQAIIGGVRVLLPHYKPLIAVPHALIAQSFFGLIVALAVVTSRRWWEPGRAQPDSARPGLRTLTAITVGAVLIQLVLGAGFRHQAFGILPHIAGAIAVAILIIWTASSVFSLGAHESYLRHPALAVVCLLFVQITLGIGAYIARVKSAGDPQPLEPLISLTASHVVVGALTLATMIVLMLRCYRTLVPRERASGAAGASRLGSSTQEAAV